jgi:dodecin
MQLRVHIYVMRLIYQCTFATVAIPTKNMKERSMSVAKIIEISSASSKSFEDAIQKGVSRASDSLSDVTGAWIENQKVVVSKGKVTEYRVQMKVTFVLKDAKTASKKK